MKFETIEEIEAPQDFTFSRFADFFRYEETARNYGADLRRVNGFTEIEVGVMWRGSIPIQGRTRGVEAVVSDYNPSNSTRIDTAVGGMNVAFDMQFEALEDGGTRMRATVEMKAKTLAARLIIQSAKLARKRLQGRIDSKIVALANEYEDEYRRLQAQR